MFQLVFAVLGCDLQLFRLLKRYLAQAQRVEEAQSLMPDFGARKGIINYPWPTPTREFEKLVLDWLTNYEASAWYLSSKLKYVVANDRPS